MSWNRPQRCSLIIPGTFIIWTIKAPKHPIQNKTAKLFDEASQFICLLFKNKTYVLSLTKSTLTDLKHEFWSTKQGWKLARTNHFSVSQEPERRRAAFVIRRLIKLSDFILHMKVTEFCRGLWVTYLVDDENKYDFDLLHGRIWFVTVFVYINAEITFLTSSEIAKGNCLSTVPTE